MTNVWFNPPPGWPQPPAGWLPPANWAPDPTWPAAPPDWPFWLPVESESVDAISAGPDHAPSANGKYEHAGQAGPGRHAVPAASSAAASPASVATGRHAAAATDPVIATAARGPERLAAPSARPQHEARDIESRTEHVAELERRIRELEQEESQLQDRITELRDSAALQDAGFYDYHHPLENAEHYRPLLADLQTRMTELIRWGRAVLASKTFSYDNSLARGRKITSDLARLMLRAYNAEAEVSLRSLRPGEVGDAVKRLEDAASTIARLGAAMELRISPDYHELRLAEIRLTADYLRKSQEEQDAGREERARLRTEQKARRQYAQQRERLDRERRRIVSAMSVAEGQHKLRESAELRKRLARMDAAIEQNERLAGKLRAGYVYVASNAGAFGSKVVKIGMTLMLDPLETVSELGDEAAPFPFDVHFYAFSEDAVALASHLHAQFAAHRVNHADPRREFFFATPQEVREALLAKLGNEVHVVEAPRAIQYYQSRDRWPEEMRD